MTLKLLLLARDSVGREDLGTVLLCLVLRQPGDGH